jgi:hypothetical protein
LLLIVDDKKVQSIKWNKHQLLAALKGALGSPKIDLTICSLNTIESDPFLSMFYPQSIRINH